jgi:hypothetical protein
MINKKLFYIRMANVFLFLFISSCCSLCGRSNEYCSIFDNNIIDSTSCCVIDKQNGRVLVEIIDHDVWRAWLKIHENGKVLWIKHPLVEGAPFHSRQNECYMDPEAKGETVIRFDPTDKNSLLVNGKKFPIEESKYCQ